MFDNQHQDGLTRWRQLFFICLGANLVLLISSIHPFPPKPHGMVFENIIDWFFNPVYGSWLWACFATGATSGIAGLLIAIQPKFKNQPSQISLATRFFFLAWLTLVSLSVKAEGSLIPPAVLIFLMATFTSVLAFNWFLNHRLKQRSEVFP